MNSFTKLLLQLIQIQNYKQSMLKELVKKFSEKTKSAQVHFHLKQVKILHFILEKFQGHFSF
jgi:hypothetical protein